MSESKQLSQFSRPRIIVAMPAYNEEKYIGTMVLAAKQYADEIIVLDNKHTFNYYTVRLKDRRINRNELRKHLESRGIQTMVYYPLSLHLQEVYASLGYKIGDFSESELAQEQVLSLPIYPELSERQIQEVVEAIRLGIQKLGK